MTPSADLSDVWTGWTGGTGGQAEEEARRDPPPPGDDYAQLYRPSVAARLSIRPSVAGLEWTATSVVDAIEQLRQDVHCLVRALMVMSFTLFLVNGLQLRELRRLRRLPSDGGM